MLAISNCSVFDSKIRDFHYTASIPQRTSRKIHFSAFDFEDFEPVTFPRIARLEIQSKAPERLEVQSDVRLRVIGSKPIFLARFKR